MSRQNNQGLNIFLGIVAVILGHILAVVVMIALSAVPPISRILGDLLFYALFGIGFTQLIYVLPLCWRLQRRERTDTLKGVAIAALLTLLLNGGCFILFFSSGF